MKYLIMLVGALFMFMSGVQAENCRPISSVVSALFGIAFLCDAVVPRTRPTVA